MKRFKFIMDDGAEVNVLSTDMESAMEIFAGMALDPKAIAVIEETAG